MTDESAAPTEAPQAEAAMSNDQGDVWVNGIPQPPPATPDLIGAIVLDKEVTITQQRYQIAKLLERVRALDLALEKVQEKAREPKGRAKT